MAPRLPYPFPAATGQRSALLCLAVLASVCVVLDASASPLYPQILYDEANAGCDPPCTVCHETNRGGWGTAVKPFAQSLIHEGLAGHDEESLREAIRYLTADSDGDGVDDLTALREGSDPNDGGESLCPVEAGCSVSTPDRRGLEGLWFALAAVGLFATRRLQGRTAPNAGRRE